MAETGEKIFGFPVVLRDDIRPGELLVVERPHLELDAARIEGDKMIIPIRPAKVLVRLVNIGIEK